MILNYSKYKKKKLENFSLQNHSTIETKRTENYNIIDEHFENIYLQCLKNIYLIKKKFNADDFFLFSTFAIEFSKFSGCDDKKGENFLERFASREFSTIELIARFLSLVELDKDVQIVKGGKEFMWKFGNPRC